MPLESKLSGEIRPERYQVLQAVKEIASEHTGVAPEEIRETDALEADLGCDSLDLVEIAMELEEHFDISFPDEAVEQSRTVGEIANGVLQLLGQHRTE